MARTQRPEEIDATALELPIYPEHLKGIAYFAARICGLDATVLIAELQTLMPQGTLYRHVVGCLGEMLEPVLERKEGVNPHLRKDVIIALKQFRPSLQTCAECGDLLLAYVDGVWQATTFCPADSCGMPQFWQIPHTLHRSWVEAKEIPRSVRYYRQVRSAVPLCSADIELMVNSLGGLNSHAASVLVQFGIELPTFLEGLWLDVAGRSRYANDPLQVIWSVTNEHFATYRYTPRHLASAAQEGKVSVAAADANVVAIPQSLLPPQRVPKKPAKEKNVRRKESPPATVVVVYAPDDSEFIPEFKLYLLPFLREHHLRHWDLAIRDYSWEVDQEIQRAALIVTFLSPQFFFELQQYGSTINRVGELFVSLQLQSRIVGVRARYFTPPNDFYAGIPLLRDRSFSCADFRDADWQGIMETIATKFALPYEVREPHREEIWSECRRQVQDQLISLPARLFGQVLMGIDAYGQMECNSGQAENLIDWCIDRDRFMHLRRVLESQQSGRQR